MSHNLPVFCKLQICFIWLASTKWQMKFLQNVGFDWMHGLIHQQQKILKAFSLFLPFKPYRLSYHKCAWLYGSKWLFFLYCLLSATQSEQKYNPLWACDPQVEENWIKKTLLYCCFLHFVYFTFVQLLCSICYKAYFTASRGAGGGSWFLYVVWEVTGFKSCTSRQLCWGWLQRHISKQEKQHKGSTMSVRNYQSFILD